MNEKLIDAVLEQIQADVLVGDYTALAELLSFVPEQYLKGYFSEELV